MLYLPDCPLLTDGYLHPAGRCGCAGYGHAGDNVRLTDGIAIHRLTHGPGAFVGLGWPMLGCFVPISSLIAVPVNIVKRFTKVNLGYLSPSQNILANNLLFYLTDCRLGVYWM